MSGKYLIIIFGPQAAGKMSVGKALCALTGLKLFHNHASLEPFLSVFDWSMPQLRKLSDEMRLRVFEEAATSNLLGLVFTYVWHLDEAEDKENIDKLCAPFRAKGIQPCFVELKTNLEERLIRNRHPERLAEKSSKRDVVYSEQLVRREEESHIVNTDVYGKFYYPDHHLFIDNTTLSPEAVARLIVERFGLT